MSKTPQFEIPTDMRKMTEQSMEQVRTAIHAPRTAATDVPCWAVAMASS